MSEEWSKKKCMTCQAEFQGRSFMKQCRECFWTLKGFDWRCPKKKVKHTPDDMNIFWYGWPITGMWSNGEKLMTIELIGGFEQYSYENWDEVWKVQINVVNPPVKASGACLICAVKEAVATTKKIIK